jgi:hypothetical protein
MCRGNSSSTAEVSREGYPEGSRCMVEVGDAAIEVSDAAVKKLVEFRKGETVYSTKSYFTFRLLHLCPRSAHAHNQSACASACVLALNWLFTAFESWTQVALFRAMADKYFTQDPVVSESMRDYADFLQTVAIEVQTAVICSW